MAKKENGNYETEKTAWRQLRCFSQSQLRYGKDYEIFENASLDTNGNIAEAVINSITIHHAHRKCKNKIKRLNPLDKTKAFSLFKIHILSSN